jgi:hypothetical protein
MENGGGKTWQTEKDRERRACMEGIGRIGERGGNGWKI